MGGTRKRVEVSPYAGALAGALKGMYKEPQPTQGSEYFSDSVTLIDANQPARAKPLISRSGKRRKSLRKKSK